MNNGENKKKHDGYGAAGYDDDIPFAWKHIILVDKSSHAGRVMAKIKQDLKSSNKNLEKKL